MPGAWTCEVCARCGRNVPGKWVRQQLGAIPIARSPLASCHDSRRSLVEHAPNRCAPTVLCKGVAQPSGRRTHFHWVSQARAQVTMAERASKVFANYIALRIDKVLGGPSAKNPGMIRTQQGGRQCPRSACLPRLRWQASWVRHTNRHSRSQRNHTSNESIWAWPRRRRRRSSTNICEPPWAGGVVWGRKPASAL